MSTDIDDGNVQDTQAATTRDGSPSRWIIGLLAGAGTTTAVTLILQVLRILPTLPSAGVARFSEIVVVVAGIAMVGRTIVHLRGGYWQNPGQGAAEWTARRRRRMSLFVILEALAGFAATSAGTILFFREQELGLALAATCITGFAVWLVSSVKHELAPYAPLERGTEIVRALESVKWIRRKTKQLGLPGAERIDRALWEWRTPADRLSSLIAGVLIALGLSTVAVMATLAPPIMGYMGRSGKPDDQTDTKSKEESGSRPSNRTAGEGNPRQAVKDEQASNRQAGPAPTYEDNCKANVKPGDGIPEPAGKEMHDAWMALGEPTLGCALAASKVRRDTEVYAVPGVCRGTFRSLGVVSPDHPAAVLIGQPALQARKLQFAGTLQGASPRVDLGAGDFQIVYDEGGSWVMIRSQKTDGKGGLSAVPTRCDQVRPGGAPYVLLSPALAEAWIALSQQLGRPMWPTRDISRDQPNQRYYAFLSDDEAHTTIAHGWCSDTPAGESCEVHAPGAVRSATAPIHEKLDVDRVLRYGPHS